MAASFTHRQQPIQQALGKGGGGTSRAVCLVILNRAGNHVIRVKNSIQLFYQVKVISEWSFHAQTQLSWLSCSADQMPLSAGTTWAHRQPETLINKGNSAFIRAKGGPWHLPYNHSPRTPGCLRPSPAAGVCQTIFSVLLSPTSWTLSPAPLSLLEASVV